VLFLPVIFLSIFFSDKSLNDARIDTILDNEVNSSSVITQKQQHCSLWEDNQDDWWQDHPDWQVSHENDTHLCFTPMQNKQRAEYYQRMHEIQFHNTNNCTDIFQRGLIGTGFAAAVSQLTVGFFYAHDMVNQTLVRSKTLLAV
jgi:hypothetical protein